MRLSKRSLLAGLALAGFAAPAAAQTAFDLLAGADLLRLREGRLQPDRLAPGAELLAVYFGASWCGPCRLFAPDLRAAYTGLRRAPRPAEVVFVSDDASPTAMSDYVIQSRMPWLCLPHETGRRSSQVQALRGLALPALVVLDRRGRTLIDSWIRPGDSRPQAALRQLRDAAQIS